MTKVVRGFACIALCTIVAVSSDIGIDEASVASSPEESFVDYLRNETGQILMTVGNEGAYPIKDIQMLSPLEPIASDTAEDTG